MNSKEYIESGNIELYVLKKLSKDEVAEVESWAAQSSDIQEEIKEVQSLIQIYAQEYAVHPRNELKNEILESIQTQPQLKTLLNNVLSKLNIQYNVVQFNTHKLPSFFQLPYTKWLFIIFLSISSVYFFIQNRKIQKLYVQTIEIQKANDIKNQQLISNLNERIDVLKSPATKEIALTSLSSDSASKVIIFWNPEKKITYLNIHYLPAPTLDTQYQLWAMIDKKTVSAGLIDYQVNSLQSMKGLDNIEGFIITLEPKGGSDSPSLEKMYAIGTL